MVAETPDFFELSFHLVSKILSSSHLEVDEIVNAADSWISHCEKERAKFSENILTKVPLASLSESALTRVLKNSTSFSKSIECVEIIKGVLDNKEVALSHTSKCTL